MAEGWLRHLGGGRFESRSAGSVATEVRPEAVAVMGEVGVDLEGQESKTLDRYLHRPFDLVVTVCDNARDTCPAFPGAAGSLHWSIADPGNVEGDKEVRLAAFRAARDELRERIAGDLLPRFEELASSEQHFRKLERMYLAAPTNEYYRPEIVIDEGRAEIKIGVRPEFFHAAGGVHGSVYFKALDDACFFAASSLVEDVFVLTSQFNIHLTRPVSEGHLEAIGKVKHSSGSSFLVAGELRDARGRLLARGEGTFVRGRGKLGPGMGYE